MNKRLNILLLTFFTLFTLYMFGCQASGAQSLEFVSSTRENLGSGDRKGQDINDQIFVKNNFGECVTTLANRGFKDCEQKQEIKRIVTKLSADTFFDFDKYSVKPEGIQTIRQMLSYIASNGAITNITIDGHTDSKGSDEYNLRLGERRANAVKKVFTDFGVKDDIIQTRSFGERNPIDTNETAEGRAKNRRVEIYFDVTISK